MNNNKLKTFAVIGDPIDHTLSPAIHNAAFKFLKMNCNYIAYKIKRHELESGIKSLKLINISGFNVTIPHKVAILNHINKFGDDCNKVGAINTVINDQSNLIGYNTDIVGFITPLLQRNISLPNCDILLLGFGGAARAVIAACAKENVRNLIVAYRNNQNKEKILQYSELFNIDVKTILINEIYDCARHYHYDLIVNATPIGLNNEPSLINDKMIDKHTIVYDLVYRPMNTNLIKQAKKHNSMIIYGYEMLLHQAAQSFELWHNRKAPLDIMKQAILRGF